MVQGVIVMIYARGPDSNKLADYASRHGWDDVRATQDFEAIMRAVRAGKVEMLLASGLTRLGKSLHGLARYGSGTCRTQGQLGHPEPWHSGWRHPDSFSCG